MGHQSGPLYQSLVLRRMGPCVGPPRVGEEMGQQDGPLDLCFLGKNDGPPGGPPRVGEEMGYKFGPLYKSMREAESRWSRKEK